MISRITIFSLLFMALICNPVFAQNNTKSNNLKKLSVEMNKGFYARSFILGPNDVLNISLNVDQYNRNNIRVGADGKISLRPFGSIQVAGLSIAKLEELLREKYSYYIKNPEPYVEVTEEKPFVAYIFGAVMNPGSHEISNNAYQRNIINTKPEVSIDRKTPLLSNVLIAAGGVRYNADLEKIKIQNPYDGSDIEVNLLDFLEGNSLQDLYLVYGDVITVPSLATPLGIQTANYKKYASASFSPRTAPVRVIGYVNKPGLVQLDTANSMSLNSAIGEAGGYSFSSPYPPKKVYISRSDENGKLVVTSVNPMENDFQLLPNDIVYVPEKLRQKVGKAFDYSTRLMYPVNSFASSFNSWSLMFDPKRFNTVIAPQ